MGTPARSAAAKMTPRASATAMPVVMLLVKNSSSMAMASGRKVSKSWAMSFSIWSSRVGRGSPASVVTAPQAVRLCRPPSERSTPKPTMAKPGSMPKMVTGPFPSFLYSYVVILPFLFSQRNRKE